MSDLPSYTVWFRGRPACPCLFEWLPAFEAELLRRGVIKHSIDIAQLIGGAEASGGTHTKGGAFDIWQHDPVTVEVGRQMGAATWARTTGSFANNRHAHGVLNGCPHNGPAYYQIVALADGYDGLGYGGRGSTDPGPGPRNLRTWREGIAWAKQLQEDDMPSPDEIRKIVDAAIKAATPAIAKAAAKEVLNANVIAKEDVTVRESLRHGSAKKAAKSDDIEEN